MAETIGDVIAMASGTRPFRVVVDPRHHGAQEVNDVRGRMQREFMRRFGIENLTAVAPGGDSARNA